MSETPPAVSGAAPPQPGAVTPPETPPVVAETPPVTPPAAVTPPETPPATAETPPATPPGEETPPTERIVPAADGYTLPKGLSPDIGRFANENGFTQEQLNGSLAYFSQVITNSTEAQETKRLTELRAEADAHLLTWGENKDYNLNLVKRALGQNDKEGKLTEFLNTSGYANFPPVLDFLLNIGVSMKEGGFLKSAVHTPPGETTAATAMFGKTHPSAE